MTFNCLENNIEIYLGLLNCLKNIGIIWLYYLLSSDDSFFNRNWAGACKGRWAGPGLLAGWDAGYWIVGAEVGLLLKLTSKRIRPSTWAVVK